MSTVPMEKFEKEDEGNLVYVTDNMDYNQQRRILNNIHWVVINLGKKNIYGYQMFNIPTKIIKNMLMNDFPDHFMYDKSFGDYSPLTLKVFNSEDYKSLHGERVCSVVAISHQAFDYILKIIMDKLSH